jgi:hypothetical protein
VKKREERTGPPAAPAFRDGLSTPNAPPGESHPARLRPIEDEPRVRYVYPETFAYGPARGADRRWGSSLVAGALSATLVASIIALAVVGFGRPVGVPPLSSPRLESEAEGDPVEVAAPSAEEQATGTSPAEAGAAPGEAPAPAPAVAGEADGFAPPGPAVPPSPVEVADEPAGGLEDQGAGQGAAGGEQGGDGTVVGGGDEIIGEPPPPQPPAPAAPPFAEPIEGDEPEDGKPELDDEDQGEDSEQGEAQDQAEDQDDSDDQDDSEDDDHGDDSQGESPIELPPGLLGGSDSEDEEDSED